VVFTELPCNRIQITRCMNMVIKLYYGTLVGSILRLSFIDV